MQKKPTGRLEVLACLMFLVLGIFIGAAFGRGWTISDMIDGASAMGTLAAAGIALWLGLRASREANKAAHQLGIIAVEKAIPVLSAVESMLEGAIVGKVFFDHSLPVTAERLTDARDTFTSVSARSLRSLDELAVAHIALIDHQAAAKIASAQGTLKQIEVDAVATEAYWDGDDDDTEFRESAVDDLTSNVERAHRRVGDALRICIKELGRHAAAGV